MCGVLSYFPNDGFYQKSEKGTWSFVFSDESDERIKQCPDTCLDKADALHVEQTKS